LVDGRPLDPTGRAERRRGFDAASGSGAVTLRPGGGPAGRADGSTGLFRSASEATTVTTVIVLVAIPAVLILGWLVLRGRHLDA